MAQIAQLHEMVMGILQTTHADQVCKILTIQISAPVLLLDSPGCTKWQTPHPGLSSNNGGAEILLEPANGPKLTDSSKI